MTFALIGVPIVRPRRAPKRMVKNGRPEPKRKPRGGKGGRTPGRVQVYNNRKWQVPSPATDPPLPPPPLFSPLGLVQLAGLVLLGLFVRLNRPRSLPGEQLGPSLTLPVGNNTQVYVLWYETEYVYDSPDDPYKRNIHSENPYVSERRYNGGAGDWYGGYRLVQDGAINSGRYEPGGDPANWEAGQVGQGWRLEFNDPRPTAPIFNGAIVTGQVFESGSYWWRVDQFELKIRGDDGELIELPTAPEPGELLPVPFRILPLEAPPIFEPLTAPELDPAPPELVPIAPPVPVPPPTDSPRPVRPLQPGPGSRPRPPVPIPPDQLAPIQPVLDGSTQAPPAPPPPVPVTPPDLVLVPGGPIGETGKAPPPTMEGIAKELGRLEQKAERGLGQGVDMADQLGEILRRLTQGEEEPPPPPPTYEFPPGQFELWPPCEPVPEGGQVEPWVAMWDGGVGEVLELRRMVEALAVLIQYHKDQRQPICKGRPAGESVTVNFIEQP